MEKAILKLFQKRVFNNGKRIPVIRRNKPVETMPCLTIEQSGNTFQKRDVVNTSKQFLRLKYSSEIMLNVWCNSEEERNDIVNQIHEILFKALSNHYEICSNFNEGECSYLGRECEALTIENGRSFKGQCPFPEKNNYSSFFKTNNILKNTFEFYGESDIDELNINPPVLRTLIRLRMDYYVYHCIGGELFDSIEIEDFL